MYYPDEIIEEVRASNDIVDVVSTYVKLTKKGSSWFGLCPFHSEKTPSFSVSRSKQIYYCFGCHSGGNVISFIMQYENYTFEEALKLLAERAGIRLPEIRMDASLRRDRDKKEKLLELHKIAANYYYRQLIGENGTAGLEYFHRRGLTDETIRHFGLGYTGKSFDGLYRMLKERGYDDEILKESGLVTIEEKGAHDKFWNRVMFPLMDVNNRVVGFGGRVLGDGIPKYMNSPETKIFEKNRFLFGLNYARKTRKDYFILCEGNMDVIALHQAGFTNAVASLGTSLTAMQPNLMKRYVNKVILTYDSDDAGVAAAMRAIPMLEEAGIAVKVLSLDPAKDPDEFLKKFGTEAFDERIDSADNAFLWSLEVLRKKYELRDPQQKTEFEHAVAKRLSEFSETLERENYIHAVSERFLIPFADLRSLVNRLGNTVRLNKEYESIRKENVRTRRLDDGLKKTQNLLLSCSAENDSLSKQIFTYLKAEDFEGDLYQTIAKELIAGKNCAAILQQLSQETELANEASAILNYSCEEADMKASISAAVSRIKLHALQRGLDEMIQSGDSKGIQSNLDEQKIWKNRRIPVK